MWGFVSDYHGLFGILWEQIVPIPVQISCIIYIRIFWSPGRYILKTEYYFLSNSYCQPLCSNPTLVNTFNMTQVINMRGKIAVLVSGVWRHSWNKKPIIKLELFQKHTAAIPRMGHHEDKARRLISLSHHCLFVMGFQQCFTNFQTKVFEI